MNPDEFKTHILKNFREYKNLYCFYKEIGGNENLTDDVLRYEYSDNPDRGNLIYATQQSRIIGAIGTIGFQLLKDGLPLKSTLLDRVLIARWFWGKDLFKKLEEIAFNIAHNNEVHFLWGLTPVPKSFVKLGYTTHTAISLLILENIQLISHIVAIENIQIKYGFDDDIVTLNQKISDAYPDQYFLCCNQKKYNWLVSNNKHLDRYCVRIYRNSDLIAFIILRIEKWRDTLSIEALMINDNENIETVAHIARNEAIKNNLPKISITLNSKNILLKRVEDIFLSLGFKSFPYNANLITKAVNKDIHVAQLYLTGIWAPPYWAAPIKK